MWVSARLMTVPAEDTAEAAPHGFQNAVDVIRPDRDRVAIRIGDDAMVRLGVQRARLLRNFVRLEPFAHAIRTPLGCELTRFRIACANRSEEHTSELQSRFEIVCRLLLEKKNHTMRFNW